MAWKKCEHPGGDCPAETGQGVAKLEVVVLLLSALVGAGQESSPIASSDHLHMQSVGLNDMAILENVRKRKAKLFAVTGKG